MEQKFIKEVKANDVKYIKYILNKTPNYVSIKNNFAIRHTCKYNLIDICKR